MMLNRALNQLDARRAQPRVMQVGGMEVDANARSATDCLAREADSRRCDGTPHRSRRSDAEAGDGDRPGRGIDREPRRPPLEASDAQRPTRQPRRCVTRGNKTVAIHAQCHQRLPSELHSCRSWPSTKSPKLALIAASCCRVGVSVQHRLISLVDDGLQPGRDWLRPFVDQMKVGDDQEADRTQRPLTNEATPLDDLVKTTRRDIMNGEYVTSTHATC